MSPLTPTEMRAAAARMFIRRRGAHRSTRRRAANLANPPAPEADMAAAPDPPVDLAVDIDAMDRDALREALRARGVEFSGRLGRERLAELLRETL